MTRSLVLIGAVLAASSGGALAADVAAGEQSFKKCVVCHSIGPDAKNKVGPAQNGLDGRKAGTVKDLVTATPIRILESRGTNKLSSNTSRPRRL